MSILIFHFNPIELYPPITNLIHYLNANNTSNIKIYIVTTKTGIVDYKFSVDLSSRINILRIGSYVNNYNSSRKLFLYFKYVLFSFLLFLYIRPKKIVYYESISALALFLLTPFFSRIKLYIHYHEYMSYSDYLRSKLLSLIYKYEKNKLLLISSWVSHTNIDRLKIFLDDVGLEYNPTKHHVFPNYPPANWLENKNKRLLKRQNNQLSFVYVGSFSSLNDFYIKEFVEWIMSYKGKLSLDIYSLNASAASRKYISDLNCSYISIKDAISYYDLPSVLIKYDIGLILYRSNSNNIKYSAPNKLFEYLCCGLDVWFPNQMLGCIPFISKKYWPKVLDIDFTKLESYNLEEIFTRSPDLERQINYTLENSALDFTMSLLKDE